MSRRDVLITCLSHPFGSFFILDLGLVDVVVRMSVWRQAKARTVCMRHFVGILGSIFEITIRKPGIPSQGIVRTVRFGRQ